MYYRTSRDENSTRLYAKMVKGLINITEIILSQILAAFLAANFW